jgi:serine/threonine protein kinase
MASLVGMTLKNRYRVDDFLGRGGMAEVYRVYDKQRNVPLAMKLLREDLAEDRVFMRRFAREAQNLTRLQHPNIVRCYGLEQEGRLVYMLMDFIEGSTLRAQISDYGRPMPFRQVLEILRPVCSALDYAHQMGVVHCDVKSANIMINRSGTVFLTDFGVARSLDTATSTMVGIGTPAYMAPEMILGKDPTPQTDIYALGILLYEMLTGGERPFTGERAAITGTTADKVRWEHIKLEPTPISKYNSTISPELEAVINTAINKKAQLRYRDAQEFVFAVARAMHIDYQSIGDRTTFISSTDNRSRTVPSTQQKQYQSSSTPSSGEKNNTPAIVLGIAGAVLLIWLIISSLNGGGSTQTSPPQSSQNTSQSTSNRNAPSYDYWVEDSRISSGSCTRIYWDVNGADEVYFEGDSVSADASSSVCPDSSSSYQLKIMGEDGNVYYDTVEIAVTQPTAKASSSSSTKSNSTCKGTGNDNNVNLRSGPNGSIIGCCLGQGVDVTIYEVDSSGKWGRIVSEKGHKGWVALKYVNIENSCDIDDLK